MQLNELFDQPAEYELHKSQSGYKAFFEVKGTKYEVDAVDAIPESRKALDFFRRKFGEIDPYSDDREMQRKSFEALEMFPTFNVSFGLTTRGGYEVTGTGNQHVVFTTVLYILAEIVRQARPIEIQFDAKEASRVKLYDKMVKKIASEFGFEDATVDTSTTKKEYLLYNKSYDNS